MKWALAVIILGVVGLVYQQTTSVKTTYVNGLPLYNTLPGREYILEKDCYIFKLKKEGSAYPFIGATINGLPAGYPSLPKDVNEKLVGSEIPGIRLLGIARSGSRFRIVSVRQDQRRKVTRTTFEILFVDELERKYPRLDAYWIMDHQPETQNMAPDLLTEIAVPRIKI